MRTLCGLCLTLIVVGAALAAGPGDRLVGVVLLAAGFLGVLLIVTRSSKA